MHRFLLFTILLFYASTSIYAQDSTSVDDNKEPVRYSYFPECVRQVYIKADSLKSSSGVEDEIEWLKENRFTCERTSPITRRVALRYLEWGDTVYDDEGEKDDKNKKEFFREGLVWARMALEEDTLDNLNYETMSMSFAAVISISGLRGKANMADSVRIYAEEALRLNPTNDRANHILGRWHYEVSKLGWFTRMLAKVVFGESPKGSFEKAIGYFERAIELDNIVVHHYWLGMAYLESGDKEKAVEEFILLQDLPLVQHNDQYFKNQAKKLMEKLG